MPSPCHAPRRPTATAAVADPALTPRQIQVVDLIANGATAQEAARILAISVRTAEVHLAAAKRRLGALSVAELVGWAVYAQVVTPRRISRLVGQAASTAAAEKRSCPEILSFPDMISAADVRAVTGADPRRSRRVRRETDDAAALAPQPVRRGRPTVMTPERVAAARQMLPTMAVTEIAAVLGVGRGTLYAHMDSIRSR
jgi:DNA-binding CsgD family transcriptional regulator